MRGVAPQLITGLCSGMPVANDAGEMVEVISELNILKAVNFDILFVRAILVG